MLPKPLVALQIYVPASSLSTSLIFSPCWSTRNRVHPLWMVRPSFIHIVRGGGSPSTGQRSLIVRPNLTDCRWVTLSAILGGPRKQKLQKKFIQYYYWKFKVQSEMDWAHIKANSLLHETQTGNLQTSVSKLVCFYGYSQPLPVQKWIWVCSIDCCSCIVDVMVLELDFKLEKPSSHSVKKLPG